MAVGVACAASVLGVLWQENRKKRRPRTDKNDLDRMDMKIGFKIKVGLDNVPIFKNLFGFSLSLQSGNTKKF